MSYVEHCNKHGQYKGDHCGECVDNKDARIAELESEVEKTNKDFFFERDRAYQTEVASREHQRQSKIKSERIAELEKVNEGLKVAYNQAVKNCQVAEDAYHKESERAEQLEDQLNTERELTTFLEDTVSKQDERIVELEKERNRFKALYEDYSLELEEQATERKQWQLRVSESTARAETLYSMHQSRTEENARLRDALKRTRPYLEMPSKGTAHDPRDRLCPCCLLKQP